ncbi:MAP/microtubule affinity-regulating kinase 3-like [Planoprotostelium fungivorum]|uniref:non-specific serine/threonine protein kinase n=1 Tax=Planoprotostelium fungivorum TaxID=1890364 RepID=A0A2P6MZD6_9EUKA|nr:MAP/microtubule affinity-regulating kinase 3-like [Planoprotostelium fungivorum]
MAKRCIGDYYIRDTIGQGTFSKVKMGVHMKTGKRVALKFIDTDVAEKTVGMTQLEREIDIHSKLDHPNVAKLIEVIRQDDRGRICLVMEHVEGTDLLDLMLDSPKGKFSEKEAAFYFSQITSAVSYIHERDIAHRDIKLENVMVAANGHCKLIDFGFSRKISIQSPIMRTPCGSSLYSAPEIMLRKKYCGKQTDMWSLGVLLYSLVSGSVPWAGADIHKKRCHAVKGEYVPLEEASPALQNLIMGCLCVAPSDRMTSMEASSHEWTRAREKGMKRKLSGKLTRIIKRMMT